MPRVKNAGRPPQQGLLHLHSPESQASLHCASHTRPWSWTCVTAPMGEVFLGGRGAGGQHLQVDIKCAGGVSPCVCQPGPQALFRILWTSSETKSQCVKVFVVTFHLCSGRAFPFRCTLPSQEWPPCSCDTPPVHPAITSHRPGRPPSAGASAETA